MPNQQCVQRSTAALCRALQEVALEKSSNLQVIKHKGHSTRELVGLGFLAQVFYGTHYNTAPPGPGSFMVHTVDVKTDDDGWFSDQITFALASPYTITFEPFETPPQGPKSEWWYEHITAT